VPAGLVSHAFTITTDAVAGAHSQAFTGIGFQPSGVFFFGIDATADGVAAGFAMSYGGLTPGAQRAMSLVGPDNIVAYPGFGFGNTSTTVAYLGTRADTGAIELSIVLASLDADGFTLTYSVGKPATAFKVHGVAFASGTFSNCRAGTITGPAIGGATGNYATAGLTFSPQLILTGDAGGVTGGTNGGRASLGAAVSGAERAVVGAYIGGSALPIPAQRSLRSDEAHTGSGAAAGTATPPNFIADLVSLDALGFTLNFTTVAGAGVGETPFFWALRGGAGNFAVGKATQPLAPGQQTVSGLGFTPSAVLFFSANTPTAFAGYPQATSARMSIGAMDDAGRQCSCWSGFANAVSPTQADRIEASTHALILCDTASPSAPDAIADFFAMTADGFTLDWTTADAQAREFVWVAFTDGVITATGSPSKKLLRGVGL
jgi:hypothetical protein